MNNIQFDTDLLSLLPPWYREVLDYQQICNAEQQQFEALAAEITAVADNFFFQTMDVSTVAQWEQIFNIVPNPLIESLDFRRARLINRMSLRVPYTINFLYQKLDELIGAGNWKVTVDYPNYTLYIESSASNQAYATEVAFTVNRIKPAHIVYVNKPYLSNTLVMSESISLVQRQYNYRLGNWSLGMLPFVSDVEQGVIKMDTTPSIQQQLLNDVATFTSSDVVSAQINGSVPITSLSKSVSGNVLTVSYSVPDSLATEITSVALLDASGNVLTQSQVYIPVAANTALTHDIVVAEGVGTNG